MLNNGSVAMPLKAVLANVVKAKAGEHYRITSRKEGKDQLQDNVIVKRVGDDLQLQYADGTQLILSNFYGVSTGDALCDLTLPGKDGKDYKVSEKQSSSTDLGDGTKLVYAHGDHDVLMAMATGDKALHSTLAGISGTELTYTPSASIMESIAGINPWWAAGGVAVVGAGVGIGAGIGGGSSQAAPAPAPVADTTAPAVTVTQNALSNNSHPIVSGTAEAGVSVNVVIAGATYSTIATNGVWSINTATATPVSGTLALNVNGSNTVSVTATDAAGNSSQAATETFTIDTTAPVLQAITSKDDQVVLTYNEALNANAAHLLLLKDGFVVLVNGVANAVTAVSVSGNIMTLTLATAIVSGASVLVNYIAPTVDNSANNAAIKIWQVMMQLTLNLAWLPMVILVVHKFQLIQVTVS